MSPWCRSPAAHERPAAFAPPACARRSTSAILAETPKQQLSVSRRARLTPSVPGAGDEKLLRERPARPVGCTRLPPPGTHSLLAAPSWSEDAAIELDGARGDGWPTELFDGSEAAGAAERMGLLGVGEEPIDS